MATTPTVVLRMSTGAAPSVSIGQGIGVDYEVTCDAEYCNIENRNVPPVGIGTPIVYGAGPVSVAVLAYENHVKAHTTGRLSSLARRVSGVHADNLRDLVSDAHAEALSAPPPWVPPHSLAVRDLLADRAGTVA
jgi:hypothetical protein